MVNFFTYRYGENEAVIFFINRFFSVSDILFKLGMKRKKKWAVEGQIKRNEDKKYILNKWQLLYSSLKCLFMRRFSRIFLSSLTRTNWKPVPVTKLTENAFWTKEKIYEHILLKVL